MECNDKKVLNMKDVTKMLGKERTTIQRWEDKGKFPKRMKDPGGGVMWRASTIEKWLVELESKSSG